MGNKYSFDNVVFDDYDYLPLFQELDDLSPMSSLDDDEEEIKEGTGIKILTQNKVLTRHPVLVAQIKAENDSYKLKNEFRQILYLLY